MGQGLFKSSYFYDLETVEYSEEMRQAIEEEVKNEPMVVYSKSYCPHARATKRLLEENDVTGIKVRDINLEEDGLQTQAILYAMTKQKTVPNTFIGGEHIGGNDRLQELAKTGQLKKMLDSHHISNNFQ